MPHEIAAAHPAPPAGRICVSCIAGRYLVFDATDAIYLRKYLAVSSVLTGTAPQHPNQNQFLGLPVELSPEDVGVLVELGVATAIHDTPAHLDRLRGHPSSSDSTRSYKHFLRRHQEDARRFLADKSQQKKAQRKQETAPPLASRDGGSDDLMEDPEQAQVALVRRVMGVTPTTDGGLLVGLDSGLDSGSAEDWPKTNPLHRYLQAAGYHITPGIRFGAQYSVYPGDPLRFHAHFLANNYGWDQEISVMDLVGSGRLATGVKKGFLVGGGDDTQEPRKFRAFCIEWAGM